MTRNREILHHMVARNASLAEIAATFGVTERTVLRWKRAEGLTKTPQPPLSDEVRARIRYLSEVEGWPTEEIAYTLGITMVTVRDHVRPGASAEWSTVASVCSRKHNALWRELRRGLRAAAEAGGVR